MLSRNMEYASELTRAEIGERRTIAPYLSRGAKISMASAPYAGWLVGATIANSRPDRSAVASLLLAAIGVDDASWRYSSAKEHPVTSQHRGGR